MIPINGGLGGSLSAFVDGQALVNQSSINQASINAHYPAKQAFTMTSSFHCYHISSPASY